MKITAFAPHSLREVVGSTISIFAWCKDGRVIPLDDEPVLIRSFCDFYAIPYTSRYDVWGDLLEPYLDTENSEEYIQLTVSRMAQAGFSKEEVDQIRNKVRSKVLAYNAVVWEWCHLGLYDLYRAFGRVEGSSNEFTQWASEIAARPWEQEGAPKQFQTYKPLSHGLMGRFNLGDLLPGALENFQSRYRQIYSLCQFVEQAMGDPARHYHDLRHIEEALELGRFSYYNQVPTSRSHDNPGYRALLWAILFHDVVYVPGRKDNEVLSAEEALQRLKETNLKSELVQIKELIEWTRTHDRKTAKTPLLRAMFDADMGIFGVGPTRYDEYARSVRVEWVGSGAVTEEQYRVGRRQFLEKVLKEAEGGSFFFALDPFFSKMAFLNIRREIESL